MTPSAIKLHRASKELELAYTGNGHYRLPAEFLRVLSPSAEVRGHGGIGGELPAGKIDVAIVDIKAVGNYGVQLVFDDGHDSGIYSWEYLHTLCQHRQQYWDDYLQQLQTAGLSRDPRVQVIRL
ncbi:MAG: 1-(5-phosphoribosyl)-5-((5-phosphoribosylamino)methylideneamino)imidazole-4-carboxamide isomerase [Gammaproteobacteria bacterium]|nr:MAG: 1-(5-phosphoribosyl)-5-((5-phosphoribosylamino)methylideneamino)imidazole-4-carboxamide isomerase [Gammaproteobacteria bacterium]